MAGIRLGAAFAATPVARLLRNLSITYNIPSPTVIFAKYAITSGLVIMADNVTKTAARCNRLIRDMTQIKGVDRSRGNTEANFLLFEILDEYGQPSNAAACAVYGCLLRKRGIVTRFRGKDHGCHRCLRIAIGTEDETASFLQALNLTLKEVHKTDFSSGARGACVVNGNGLNWPQEQKPGQHQTS
ncbi:Histidinol-phosphate aminotransferase [Metarhizium anisopliae]